MGTHRGDACGCGAARVSTLPIAANNPPRVAAEKTSRDSKYFQEIGAEMIGNQLIIRVEKDRNRSSRRKDGQWEPSCDCEMPEIRMPTSTEGPRIVNAGDNNQILFRVRSRTLVGKDDAGYEPEAFSYQLGAAKKAKDLNDQHRAITIHPSLSDPSGSQEVHSDHITDGNQNIYLLRIKKKGDTPSQRKRNIELELRTPKPPTPVPARKVVAPRKSVEAPAEPEVAAKAETTNGAKKAGGDKKKKKKK